MDPPTEVHEEEVKRVDGEERKDEETRASEQQDEHQQQEALDDDTAGKIFIGGLSWQTTECKIL